MTAKSANLKSNSLVGQVAGRSKISSSEGSNQLTGPSTKPVYTIGQVVDKIKIEFPTLTVSKLRYFESQGLVTPHRTSSGYRKYSEADISRLRFILAAQRDSYMPLKEIQNRLDQIDKGQPVEVPKIARLVARDGRLVAGQHTEGLLTTTELLDMTAISRSDLDLLIQVGLLRPDLTGRFPARSHRIVRLAMILIEMGIPAKKLRFLKTTADRVADFSEEAGGGLGKQISGIEKEKRHAQILEVSQITAELFNQLIKVEVEQID